MIVYTNPPCNDRKLYHKMTEKYIRQVDTSVKLCYKCDHKAVIKDKNVLRKKR